MNRHAVALILAALAASAPAASPAQSSANDRDSHAAAMLEAWIETYNRQDLAAMEAFAQERFQPAWLAQTSADRLAIAYRNWHANYGGFRLAEWAARSPLSAEAVVYSPMLDACHGLFVELDRAAPEKVEGVYLEPFARRACPESDPPRDWPGFQSALRDYLDGLAAADRFNGVVLVKRRGHTIVHEARGLASLTPPRQNSLGLRFELASISKLFTAVAVARLVEEGRLSFDDTLASLLPEYPDEAAATRIKVRHLLTHTSGVEDYYRSGAIFAEPRSRSALQDYWRLFAMRPLLFEPGARYDYSNSNYVLLGSIVERMTGERFESFVEREIFARAGMRRACYCAPGGRGAATPLTAFTTEAGPLRRVSADGVRQVPAGAARPAPSAGYATSSARDLAKFAERILNGRLISRDMFERMLTPQTPMDDGGEKGLGFDIYDIDGVRFVGHSGNSWGVSAQLDIYPEAEVVVVILSNRDSAGTAALSYKTRRWIAHLVSQ